MFSTSHVAIVGGHGQIATLLIPLLAASDHQVTALSRSEDHTTKLEALGASWRHLDIENATDDDYDSALAGADAIVFAAGGGADGNIERKNTVDLGGSLASMAAAERLGIRRFVQISAIATDETPDANLGAAWVAYSEAKSKADAALRNTNLAWTIIRPGRLTNERGTGLVTIADTVERSDIPRADVAAVLAAVIDDERTFGQQWEVIGGSTPIDEALSGAAN